MALQRLLPCPLCTRLVPAGKDHPCLQTAASAGPYAGGSRRSATLDAITPRGTGSVGTEMGRDQVSHVSRTSFTRKGAPEALAVQYDTIEVLNALGVTSPALPEPFPGRGTGYQKY
jgi:hypothetical protein